jgi:hypothetical protein
MRPDNPPEADDPDEERDTSLRPCRVTLNPTHHQLRIRNLEGQVMRSARALAARSWGRYDWQVSDCLRQLRQDVDALARAEADPQP